MSDSRDKAVRINAIINKAADAVRQASSEVGDVINDGVSDPVFLVDSGSLEHDLRTAADDLINLELDEAGGD